MKKYFENFLNLFFPDPEEGEKNPLWQKIIGIILVIIVVVFFMLASQ